MSRDKGQPSGTNKTQAGTGIPTRMSPEDMPNDQEKTEKYTEDEADVANHIDERHPNRNTDKGDATNIGGYRN
jgi:hypothetical protein